jgi:hypothetical protein
LPLKYEPVARKKAMPREDFMSHADYPGRLRELARHCGLAAKVSLELEAKTSFRTIGERLSTMADEIEQSDALKGQQDFGAGALRRRGRSDAESHC